MTSLKCSFCLPGYFMDSLGDCQQCVYSLEKGCYFCSSKDPTKCEICDSGYYMDKSKY